jgi:hypothetical protein
VQEENSLGARLHFNTATQHSQQQTAAPGTWLLAGELGGKRKRKREDFDFDVARCIISTALDERQQWRLVAERRQDNGLHVPSGL